jgi:hypothetical protein
MAWTLVYDPDRELSAPLELLFAAAGVELLLAHEASEAIGQAGHPELAAVVAIDRGPSGRALEVLDLVARARAPRPETLIFSDDPTAGAGRHRRLPLALPSDVLAALVARTARAAEAGHEARELRRQLEQELAGRSRARAHPGPRASLRGAGCHPRPPA